MEVPCDCWRRGSLDMMKFYYILFLFGRRSGGGVRKRINSLRICGDEPEKRVPEKILCNERAIKARALKVKSYRGT